MKCTNAHLQKLGKLAFGDAWGGWDKEKECFIVGNYGFSYPAQGQGIMLIQWTNERGGETDIFFAKNNREMQAYLQGILYASK